MSPEEVARLEPGLYRIHWEDDSTSLGTVGRRCGGLVAWAVGDTDVLMLIKDDTWNAVKRADPVLLTKHVHLLPADHKLFVGAFPAPATGQPIGAEVPVDRTTTTLTCEVFQSGLGRYLRGVDLGVSAKSVESDCGCGNWANAAYPTHGISVPQPNTPPAPALTSYGIEYPGPVPAACSACGVWVSREYRRYHDRCIDCRGK